jgi:DNA (cytosine-5)-methyltransferase 1
VRILDLFCGAGGAAMGYHQAGFEVVGVDSRRQRNYPFEFHQADAMTYPFDGFDVIHASPPCQAYSITKHAHKKQHPDLLGPTRQRLIASGKPYVIENVPGASMPGSITLCGASFGLVATDTDGSHLVLKRHRQFESNLELTAPACECKWFKDHGYKVGGVYGGGSTDRHHAENVRHGGYTPAKAVRQELMGIDWMSMAALNQAIPPVYTFHLGKQIMEQA